MNTNPLKKAVKAAIVASLALTVSLPSVYAADADDGVEEVVVTGSRIVRNEFNSSSPITVASGEEIALAGVVSVDEFLKDIPAFTGFQAGTSTNNGSPNGQKKVDLRGLGFNRTLVLVNGRRTIGDAAGDGAVDLNFIPEAMIKRVEVLKDGASTIYGSDALAGVVNIILHDDFEGVEFGATYGAGISGGEAKNNSLSVVAGLSGDRGNVVMALSHVDQNEMLQAERDFAQDTLYPALNATSGQFEAIASGSSNSRRIRVAGVGNFIVDEVTGAARPFDFTSDTYNFAPVNALTQPNERWQFAANGTFSINDNIDSYFDTIYTRRTSQQRLAPDASFSSRAVDTPNNGSQNNDFVPANNPFNPFGVNPNNALGLSGLDVRINRRFEESGGRLFGQTADTYRMVAGLKGSVLNEAIGWDASYTYAETETVNATSNLGRFDRWAIAVDPVACAADAECAAAGVLNPFSPFGGISQEQFDFLLAGRLKDQIGAQMELFSLNFNGDITEMAGGTAGWAAGYEHRNESGFFSPDEFIGAGQTTGGAADPLQGSFSVDEVYGEVLLPVIDTLDLSASLRFSDYDTVGNATTYKIGADWQIMEGLRARATFATGFRAPNISEINQEETSGFPVVESLCEFADRRLANGDITQAVVDNCTAFGIPTDDSGEFGFAWQSQLTTRAPTQQLEAEESESFNVGFVYEPAFLEGLSVGLDFWNIEIDKVIGASDINDLFDTCLRTPNAGPTVESCAPFYVDGGFGPYDINANFIFPGNATVDFGNLGVISTDGIDLDIAYGADLDYRGVQGYNLTWATTILNSYEQDFPAGVSELAGTADGFAVFPELRMNIGAGIYGENWTFDWNGRYIGETDDRRRPAYLTDDSVAEDVLYHDIVGTYTYNNMTFNLGINNLSDEDAPRFHSAFNANTEPGTYDVVGRAFYAGFKVRF